MTDLNHAISVKRRWMMQELVVALMTCEEHNGDHEFSVREGGRRILMKPQDVGCVVDVINGWDDE